MEEPIKINAFITKLKEVLEANPKGAVLSDMRKTDQPIIYCNKNFLEMTGYAEDDVVGRNCRFLQKEDREQGGLFVLRSAIKARQSCKVVLRNYRKSGELFFNRLSVSPIFNDAGLLTHFMGIQDDVTDLISTRKELEETAEENEVLLAEVHHRVKNNLSIMSSFLELENAAKSEQDVLQKSRLRINSMALIHERLYQKEGLAYIEIAKFIKELTAHTSLFNNGKCRLQFDFNLQPVELNINQAIPFSIIVSELIDNAARHAYVNDDKGKVEIALTKNGGGNIVLKIKDYGSGLPEAVNISEPTTLGFTVVKTLLSQINATAEQLNTTNGGFEICIKIPSGSAKGPSQNWRVGV